ncbi:MAG: PocR ligand-binding domain-containing protein [Candidatus Gastranaerophilaceae bacterium]
MFNKQGKIILSDLVNVKFLQELQNNFARTIGIASLMVDDNGPITKPDNFTDFCAKHIRANESGAKKCIECDIEGGKLAAKNGKPVIYSCHAGLTHFAVPIMVEGKHIASILGGQFSLEKPDEEHFKKVAKKLGIKEGEKYIKDLRKINVIPKEKIEDAAQLLFVVANGISEMANKNYELKKINRQEALLRSVTGAIRSTLDINKVKKIIVNTVGKNLNADRCFIAEYDKKEDKFSLISDEYLSSDDVMKFKGTDANKELPHFIEALKRGESLIINNKEIFLNANNYKFDIEREAIEKFKVTSAIALPLFYNKELLGTVSIQYIKEHFIDKNEIKLIKFIANQVSIAIHQARLYKATQKLARRETLIRSITEAIRNSLDVDETKQKIVGTIGKALNADRCFIMEYDKTRDKFLIIDEEYLSSDNVLSYKGVNLNENIPHLTEEFKKGKSLIMNKERVQLGEEKIDFNEGSFEVEKKAIEKYKVRSALVFPLYYSGEFLGSLGLHYVEEQSDIGEDEINFLNLIANQIALALHQAKLYEKIQLQAERERISRTMIEILRSTLDKKTIKSLFVKNIGKYFKADRVFFSEFDYITNQYSPVGSHSEYLSSSEEKSFVNYDLSGPIMGGHIQPLTEKRELLVPNWKEYIGKTFKNSEFVALYEEANVKSSYSFPVLYEGKILGYFCIEFTQKICELAVEDINRIRNICAQAGIALYHAELYMQTQEALHSKVNIIEKVKRGIKEPVDNIIKTSNILSEFNLERDKQLEYLNSILTSCDRLLELTKDICEPDY